MTNQQPQQTICIIQARNSSTRFPGKSLQLIGDYSILAHCIRNAFASRVFSAVYVATTTAAVDNTIITEALKHGAMTYRGSDCLLETIPQTDVLARFLETTKSYLKFNTALEPQCLNIARITADNPFVLPSLIREAVQTHYSSDVCYTTTWLPERRTFPYGMDIEVFDYGTLRRTAAKATSDYHRAHVTAYMQSKRYITRKQLLCDTPGYENCRLSVDTIEDLDICSKVYNAVVQERKAAHWVVDYTTVLKNNPELRRPL